MRGDPQARATLVALLTAGAREDCPDYRTGEEQELVALGADPAWGYAIVKGALVVTVVDPDGARYLRARSQRPATKPQLRRVAPEAHELARYALVGVRPPVTIAVAPDGAVSLVGDGRVLR